jgi:regulator of cell morphogenesis and NO signaling
MKTEEITIGSLVAERPDRSRIFEKYSLDYCCGGKLSLVEACQRKGLDIQKVEADLAEHDKQQPATERDWSGERSASVVIDHIMATYHAPLPADFQRISELAQKVARVHGKENAYLVKIAQIWEELRRELEMHLTKEEQILFPMIKSLEEAANAGEPMPALHCGSVNNPMRQMEHEHDEAGEALQQIAELTNQLTAPEHACNSWRALYQALEQFTVDLHRHIHLENIVLHPLARNLEASLC